MDEEWRPAPGWPRYEVSSLGRVRSWFNNCRFGPRRRVEPLIRVPYFGTRGYGLLNLRDSDRPGATVSVHRLVAAAFLGPCPEGMEVSHLNGDPRDNRVENLAYERHGTNLLRKREHGTMPMGETHARAKLSASEVASIRGEYAAGGITQRELAEKRGLPFSTMQRILQGRLWTHIEVHEPGGDTRPARGTLARGERSGTAKLSDVDIQEIRATYARGGITQRELATRYGISQSNVSIVVRGKGWRHVETFSGPR